MVGVFVERGVLDLADGVHLGLRVEGGASHPFRSQEELEVLIPLLLPVSLGVSIDLARLPRGHPLAGELLAAPADGIIN